MPIPIRITFHIFWSYGNATATVRCNIANSLVHFQSYNIIYENRNRKNISNAFAHSIAKYIRAFHKFQCRILYMYECTNEWYL